VQRPDSFDRDSAVAGEAEGGKGCDRLESNEALVGHVSASRDVEVCQSSDLPEQ